MISELGAEGWKLVFGISWQAPLQSIGITLQSGSARRRLCKARLRVSCVVQRRVVVELPGGATWEGRIAATNFI